VQTFAMQTFAVQTFAMQTLAVQTFAVQTLAMQTLAMQTFAMQTFAVQAFAMQTLAVQTGFQKLRISTGAFSMPPAKMALWICPIGTETDIAGQRIAAQGGQLFWLARAGESLRALMALVPPPL